MYHKKWKKKFNNQFFKIPIYLSFVQTHSAYILQFHNCMRSGHNRIVQHPFETLKKTASRTAAKKTVDFRGKWFYNINHISILENCVHGWAWACVCVPQQYAISLNASPPLPPSETNSPVSFTCKQFHITVNMGCVELCLLV